MARVRRLDWRGAGIIAGAVVIGLVIAWVLYVQQRQREQIGGLSTALAAQRRQAQQAGQTPVAQPPASVRANPDEPTMSPSSAPAEVSPDSLAALVHDAVVAYFAEHPVVNDTPPRPAVVQRYVDRYLAAHPAPSGPVGASGSPGTDGTNGTDGTPGRGISSTACTDTHLIVSYDDGTTQDLGADSCGRGPKGDQGEPGRPVASYTYTVHGPLGDQTYSCVWDGQSTDSPHYDCTPTN